MTDAVTCKNWRATFEGDRALRNVTLLLARRTEYAASIQAQNYGAQFPRVHLVTVKEIKRGEQ